MENIINRMLNHPFATIMIIGCIADSTAKIISATKGNKIEPVVSIISGSTPSKTE